MKQLLCLLLAAMLLCAAGCGSESVEESMPIATAVPSTPIYELPPVETPPSTELPTNVPQAPHESLLDGMVTDAFRFEQSYTDDFGSVDVSLSIPQIHLAQADTTQVNQAIYDTLIQDVNATINNLQNGEAPYAASIRYTATLQNHVLCVVTTRQYYTYDHSEIDSFCVDVETGSAMDQADIAAALGISHDQLKQAIATAAQREFETLFAAYAGDEDYDVLLRNTVSDETLSLAQCYFDEDGQLMAACRICSFIGAKYVVRLLPIQI